MQDAGLRLAITLAQKAVKTALSTVKHEQPLLNPLLVGGVADSVAESKKFRCSGQISGQISGQTINPTEFVLCCSFACGWRC